jgi:cysteine-rich repeat protein
VETCPPSIVVGLLCVAVAGCVDAPPGNAGEGGTTDAETGQAQTEAGEICGDGVVDPDEECDLGQANADGAACTSMCRTALCGDGLLHEGVEACDDGNAEPGDGCSAQCALPRCGDGVVDPEETCDDGNDSDDDGCTGLCAPPTCGDGRFTPSMGEACDDGNDLDFDGCPSDCMSAECGDGVHEGLEECDDGDGNGSGDFACTVDCVENVCGDGYHFFQEECDDGTATGNGASDCNPSCELNTCGDGYLHTPTEECDDRGPSETCGRYCDTVRPVLGADGGWFHTCALVEGGSVRCWGEGADGRLGYGNEDAIGDNEWPAVAHDVDVGADVDQVTTGSFHTCALTDTADVRCWGWNETGQLGYPGIERLGDDELPSSVVNVDVGGDVIAISTSGFHTCALLEGGTVRCWGSNYRGQLGYGHYAPIGDDEAPSTAGDVDVGGTVVQITTGREFTCALLMGGTVRCWGEAGDGQLGYGDSENIGDEPGETPASVGDVPLGVSVAQVVAGGHHTCVITVSGGVRCWGTVSGGQIGYPNGAVGEYELPTEDVDVGGTVVGLALGRIHTCAVLDTGAVRCWGDNFAGQLGYGHTDEIGDDETPASAGDVPLAGAPGVLSISAGDYHTCAVLDTGAMRCWGNNEHGALGLANTAFIGDDEVPTLDVKLY